VEAQAEAETVAFLRQAGLNVSASTGMKVRKKPQVAAFPKPSGAKAAAKLPSSLWRFLRGSTPNPMKPLSLWQYLGGIVTAVFCLAANVYGWWTEELEFAGAIYSGAALLVFCLSLLGAGISLGGVMVVRASWQWPQSAERLGFSCTQPRCEWLLQWGSRLFVASLLLFYAAQWMAGQYLQTVSLAVSITLVLLLQYWSWRRAHSNS
jgi:hypothetical protein